MVGEAAKVITTVSVEAGQPPPDGAIDHCNVYVPGRVTGVKVVVATAVFAN